jgi:phosphatidylinositol glycan class O
MDRYLLFLFWSNLIFGTTVFLFQRGFLLSREVLPDRTECSNFSVNETCYKLPKQYSKAVVVIIDAFRYDFAVYDKNVSVEDLKPYQNALPIINTLIEEGSGKLFESYADPPTTTMQRLKGLTTGSIPTFIDISANFASYEISEDNIIDQLVNSGRKVVFTGDDTWLRLFPNRFTRTYAFPSFDVWDLDTVDRGVSKHLFRELSAPQNWDVLIGHYLGVDHAGHKYGPIHSEMRRKLKEMNLVIEKLVDDLPEDCVLFVMGDHGMTLTGDHGGDSDDELSAALFIYSKRESRPPDDGEKRLANDGGETRSNKVNQVDFVPTFSLLMGLPIPFSNIGKVIYNVFVPNASRQLQYLKINVDQVFTYLSKYRTSHEKALPQTTFERIENMTMAFRGKKAMRPSEVEDVLQLGVDLLSNAKAMCQATFIEFDLTHIWRGLTMSSLHISIMVVLSLDKIFLRSVVNPKLFVNLTISFLLGAGLSLLTTQQHEDQFKTSYILTVFAAITLPVCGLNILWRIRHSIGQVISAVMANTDAFSLFHILLGFIVCVSLFSNSYVVEEGHIYSFCVISSFVAHLLQSHFVLSSKKNVFIAMYMLGIIKCTTIYFRCREEQQSYCEVTDFHKPIGTLPASVSRTYKNWRFFSTILAVVLVAVLPNVWLRRCGNLNGMALPVLIAKYIPTIVGLALVFQWALQKFPEEMAAKLLPWQHNFLAQFVYAVSLVSIILVLARPHLTFLVDNAAKKQSTEVPKLYEEGAVKTYFNLMKTNWKEHFTVASSKANSKVTVFGLGAGISAAFVVVGIFLAFLSMLILGDGLCPSMWLAAASMTFYLYLTSSQRLVKATSIGDLMHVPWTSVIGWALLEGLYFYGTGHQPTFPSIQWGAAFVGFSGTNYGGSDFLGISFWLPALLIGWNTFVSRLWFGFMLPLLLVAPFTVFMTVPSARELCAKNLANDESLAQGETVLIEQRDEAKSHMFRLCVKYSVILGIRMLTSMLAATHLRRHLMVWKIFAPRFMFEAVGFAVSLFAMSLGYWAFVRIQSWLSEYLRDLASSSKEK